MKRLFKPYLIAVLAAMMGSSMLTSCGPDKGAGGDGGEDSVQTVYKEPKELVTVERAIELTEAYADRAEALKKLKDGKMDSRYGWHDLNFYKNYIGWLEQEAKKKGIEVSGLRTYYVAYPNEDPTMPSSAGFQTYLYVPTYKNPETGKDEAFDLFHFDENGKPLPIGVVMPGLAITYDEAGAAKEVGYLDSKGVFKKASFVVGEKSSAANIAQMCPTTCD